MGIDESLVGEIVRRVLAVARPERIILFWLGRYGPDDPGHRHRPSCRRRGPGNRRKESVRFREILRGLGYPVDVIVIPTEWFEESKRVIVRSNDARGLYRFSIVSGSTGSASSKPKTRE